MIIVNGKPTYFDERWAKNGHRYPYDVALFLRDQWVVRDAPPNIALGPDNCLPILTHQEEILRTYFPPDVLERNEPLPFDEMLFSTIKKSGKTELEGGVAEWSALTFPGTPEQYFIGNDKEQAQTRAFAAIGLQIAPSSKGFNPVVAAMFDLPSNFKVKRSTDQYMLDGGGFMKSIPVDYSGEAGGNPSATFWDELWGVEREAQRRLWDEMTPPPTRRNPFRFVATYAGFRNESELLWDLYARIVGEKASERKKRRIHPTLPIYAVGKSVAYWDEGEEARRLPWQTPEYYKREKAANRPEMFERIHMNRWQENAANFITAEQWAALDVYEPGPIRNAERYPCYAFVDAAHRRDTTTGVIVEYLPILNAQGVAMKRIVAKQTWRPTREQVVLPEETALPWLRGAIQLFNIQGIGYDPNHFETSAELLKRDYPSMRIEATTQSPMNLVRIGTTLYDTITKRALIVYAEPESDGDALRQHVLNAKAQPTPIGYRIVKGKDANKVDGAISLAGALDLANRYGPQDATRGIGLYMGSGDDDEFDD